MNGLRKFGIADNALLFRQDFTIGEDGKGELPLGLSVGALILRGLTLPEKRVFAGDLIGQLTLRYSDGDCDIYDLIVGETLWWGDRFAKYCEPLKSDPVCNAIFCDCMKLCPRITTSDEEGYYLCIKTAKKKLDTVEYSGRADCIPCIHEVYATAEIPEAFINYIPDQKNVNAVSRNAKIKRLYDLLYVNDENFPTDFVMEDTGDRQHSAFAFDGNRIAKFYTNVMNFNLLDMMNKIDDDGYGHTSTLGAPWYGYDGIGGTYTNDGRIYPDQKPGHYYAECWTRDFGRIMIELIRFGREENVRACIEWLLKAIRHWEDDDAPTLEGGHKLPRHVQRILQRFETEYGHGCFENDGHAMCALALWLLWKRNHNSAWIEEYKEDILALGDWYIWQFEHPELSHATDVLWSDSESSGWPFKTGLSFYVDFLSAEALCGIAEIADALGESASAEQYRELADRMIKTAEKYYLGDWNGERCWCANESWDPQTSLAHIILACDRGSLNSSENKPEWREYDRIAGIRNRGMYSHGGALGYNQAFTIQCALLEDDMRDAASFLEECALMIYNPVHQHYIIPESAIPVGRRTYTRMGDLGNGVQQAEILKCLRIIVGIDDLTEQLTFIPRLPDGWDKISAERFAVYDKSERYSLDYSYSRTKDSAEMFIRADRPLPAFRVRLGAFDDGFEPEEITVNGRKHEIAGAERISGKTWFWLNVEASNENEYVIKLI